MKTDLIEIFQTIRAELQPFAALGFTNRINSEEAYDLWSEKNIKEENVTERFFAEVKIEGSQVVFRYADEDAEGKGQIEVAELDDLQLSKIQDQLAITHTAFKEQEWV
jgi:hypothetical protein